MNDLTKAGQSTQKSQIVSLTGQSSTTLTNNIRVSSEDEQRDVDRFLTKRCDTLMEIGFQSDMPPERRAEVVNEYRRALRHFPKWVLAKAIDKAVAKGPGRPTPGQINALADESVAYVQRELSRRGREGQREAERPQGVQRKTIDQLAQGQRDLIDAGFTPKRFNAVKSRRLAGSEVELYSSDVAERVPHWTEAYSPDSPDMQALQAARDENPLVAAAREDARKSAIDEAECYAAPNPQEKAT